MPYVEVWVEDAELDEEQIAAVRDLVKAALEVSGRQWPADDAILLNRAAERCRRVIDIGVDAAKGPDLFATDEKYRKWRAERGMAAA